MLVSSALLPQRGAIFSALQSIGLSEQALACLGRLPAWCLADGFLAFGIAELSEQPLPSGSQPGVASGDLRCDWGSGCDRSATPDLPVVLRTGRPEEHQ